MNETAVKFLKRAMLSSVKGDAAEIGLMAGHTFKALCRIADTFPGKKICHGFDSFEGMGEPGPKDMGPNGGCNYPKGKFSEQGSSIKGLAMLRHKIGNRHCVYKGWVPEVFAMAPEDLRLCFAYLDVDHYQPTVDALAWVWPRIEHGGIMLCHDVVPDQKCLATVAVNEWMEVHRDEFQILESGPQHQMAFQRPV